MAWGRGAASGLDDLCARLRANDPKLQSLTILKHRKVDYDELKKLCASLENNTVLTELYASNHAVTPDAALLLSQLLQRNATLTALCIGNSSFGDEGVSALSAGIGSSKSLSSLDLENKNITASGAATISKALAQSCSLQHLSLARNPLADAGAAALSESAWNTLTHLDVSSCALGPCAITSLAAQPGSGCLTTLNLSNNNLGAEAGPGLEQLLSRFTSLQRLQLRACQLEDASIEALARALPHHRAIQLLDLRENCCEAAGGAALAAALGSDTTLQHLNLGSNPKLPAASVESIARAVSSGGERSLLQHLDLTGTDLGGQAGAAAVVALSACGGLRHLWLLGTKLGDDGAQQLVDCLARGGFAALSELSVSACGLELDGGLGPLLRALLSGHARSLQVLECGANPACQRDELSPLVLDLRSSRPELQVHWAAMDEAAKVEVSAAGGAPSGGDESL